MLLLVVLAFGYHDCPKPNPSWQALNASNGPLMNQVAIITGGGRNIGRAIALRLAQDGFAVVVAGIEPNELRSVAGEVEQLGGRGLAVDADVTLEDQIAGMVEQTLRAFGRIDVLVNNAAVIGPTAPVADIRRADWEQVLA